MLPELPLVIPVVAAQGGGAPATPSATTQADPAGKRAPNPALVRGSTVVLVSLTLCLLLMFIAFVLLRRHHHRVSRMKTSREERAAKAKKGMKPDPWVESARRMDPERVKEETSDTVDFDPRELSSEDIWPPDDDPPRNGHGKHDPGQN